MPRSSVCISFFILLSTNARTQTSPASPKFDIADIHPTTHVATAFADGMHGGLMRGGRYEIHRASLLDLIASAWGMPPEKVVGGPNWLEVDRFDITAKADPNTKSVTAKLMLRDLLTERFHLAVHNDTKPLPAFALTAGKGVHLHKSGDSDDSECKVNIEPGTPAEPGVAASLPEVVVTCIHVTMAVFAGRIPQLPGVIMSTPITDRTGLDGAWDFSFRYNERTGTAAVFEAVDNQLGLRLSPSTLPLPVLVVDSVDRKPAANSPEVAAVFPLARLEFDVAEVKPTDPDFQGTRFQTKPGGLLDIRGESLKQLIRQVWSLSDEQISGAPKFADIDRWNIIARAPASGVMTAAEESSFTNQVDSDTVLEMLKSLLADRFRFAFHMEDRTLPVWTLSAIRPKMKKADPASRTSCKEGPATLSKNDTRNANPALDRLMTCRNTSMAYLAEQLQLRAKGYVRAGVFDATGLEGGYDFALSFSGTDQLRTPSNGASDPNGAVSLPEAIEKQLGLKLEQMKRKVPVMVIDHMEQKPTDN